MPRAPRNIASGDISHTTFRTHNKEFLFLSAQDHAFLLRALVRTKERFGAHIYTLVGMSNHYHFIHDAPTVWHEETEYARKMKEGEKPVAIGDLLREMLSYYVNCFNRAKGREGSIVKDRTKTVRQQCWQQEMTTAFYNFANPVKAGMVNHPEEYLFHNYHFYAHGYCKGPWRKFQALFTYPEWYMRLAKTWSERQRKFRKLMQAYLREHGLVKFPGASHANGPGRDVYRKALEDFLSFSYAWAHTLRQRFQIHLRGPPKKPYPSP